MEYCDNYNYENLVPYTSLSYAEFTSLTYRKQLEEYMRLGLSFDTEKDLLTLLVPADDQYSSDPTIHTLPTIPDKPSLQQILRHMAHLEKKLCTLIKHQRKLTRVSKRLVSRAASPLYLSSTRRDLTTVSLQDLYNISVSVRQHRTLLTTLAKQHRAHTMSYKRHSPRTIFLPSRFIPYLDPLVPPLDGLTPTEMAHSILSSWDPPPDTKPTPPPPKHKRHRVTPTQITLALVDALNRSSASSLDITGGFKQNFTHLNGSLSVLTLNTNGLTEGKLDHILAHMICRHIHIAVLTDTRVTSKSLAFLSRKARATLGPGTRIHGTNDPTTQRNRQNAIIRIGGIMFIIGPTWGPSLFTSQDDYSKCGTLSSITLQSSGGHIHIMGTYWPINHAIDEQTIEMQNLCARLAYYLQTCDISETPTDYLKRLACKWAHAAVLRGAHAVILAGDLNSTWLASDAGGQRSIAPWATDAGFINGPRLLADHRGDFHITHPGRADGSTRDTWIDHILHMGDVHLIDPIASYSSTGADWTDISDHRPMWTIYATGRPSTPIPKAATIPTPRPELDLSDRRIIEDYACAMHKYALRRTPDLTTPETASKALLELQSISPIIANQINKNYGKNKQRPDMKDGWSPAYMALKLYLITVTEIRRRLTGTKGRKQWSTQAHSDAGITWLLTQLATHTASLSLQPDVLAQLYASTDCAPDWWRTIARMPTIQDCDNTILTLRRLMHGRHRTDLRRSINQRVAKREHLRETGKCGMSSHPSSGSLVVVSTRLV